MKYIVIEVFEIILERRDNFRNIIAQMYIKDEKVVANITSKMLYVYGGNILEEYVILYNRVDTKINAFF